MSPWGDENRGKGSVQAGWPLASERGQSPRWAAGWGGQAWQGGSDEMRHHSAELWEAGCRKGGRRQRKVEGGMNAQAATVAGGQIYLPLPGASRCGMWDLGKASWGIIVKRAHGGVRRGLHTADCLK